HGKLAHLLVGYDGYIYSVACNIEGRVHDTLFGHYNEGFRQVCADTGSYALTDTGYNRVSYAVAGFKSAQVTTPQHQTFDSVSRSEQVVVEHINCLIKKCRSLTKESKFIHSHHKLAAIVLIVCGWYNWRRRNGFICADTLPEETRRIRDAERAEVM